MCGGLCSNPGYRNMMSEVIREFTSTLLLTVITGIAYVAFNATINADLHFPLAYGLAIVVLATSEKVLMNPVVAVAMALVDVDFGWIRLFYVLAAQFGGAIIGGIIAIYGIRKETLNFGTIATTTAVEALCVELMFAFLIVIVFLRTKATVLGGLMYGFAVVACSIATPLIFAQQGLFNPAVALGLVLGSVAHDKDTQGGDIWLYLVGPFLGALLAVCYVQVSQEMGVDDSESEDDDDDTTEPPKRVRTQVMEVVPQRPRPGYGPQNPNNYGNRPAGQPVGFGI